MTMGQSETWDRGEQERRLRVAISDAIQDSLGTMMLNGETLDDMVEAIVFAIEGLVGYAE